MLIWSSVSDAWVVLVRVHTRERCWCRSWQNIETDSMSPIQYHICFHQYLENRIFTNVTLTENILSSKQFGYNSLPTLINLPAYTSTLEINVHTSRCTVIRTFEGFFLTKVLWGPRRPNIRNFCYNYPWPTIFWAPYFFGPTRPPLYV